MGITITIKENKIPEVVAQIKQVKQERMQEAVNLVRNHTVEKLSGTRHGRTYRVPGTKVYYTASSPGEPPATATARLRQSIKTEIQDEAGLVGTDVEYGLYQEMGTRNILPRPWLRPSFEESEPEVRKIFERPWL